MVAPLSRLIDKTIKNAVAEWWPSGVPAPQWNVGPGWVEFPSFHTKIIGSQEMEWKGNFIVDVECRLLTSLRTEGQDSYTYDGMVDNHTDVAGRMEQFLSTGLTTTDLEDTPTASHYEGGATTSNAIEKVYEIRLTDYYADLDESDMVLEHKWTLQVLMFPNMAVS